jgi:2-polyprenyl-3-methyl-5-hydroxy-6-metoxy-1,4-benzoquinol methylase
MEEWKARLYKGYVSSGQAANDLGNRREFKDKDYPYLVKLIRTYVPHDHSVRIADLACGHGALLFCLKQLGYSNIQGIDISEQQVKLAHEMGMTEIQCRDIVAFLKQERDSLDVIFMMDILEHLKKDELINLLDDVNQALRVGGTVIIHVPNAEGIHGMRIRYGDLTHENCFTSQSIRQALQTCGFQNVVCAEDMPIVHGATSLVRHILWRLLTVVPRVLLSAETGVTRHILSQNLLAVAQKRHG